MEYLYFLITVVLLVKIFIIDKNVKELKNIINNLEDKLDRIVTKQDKKNLLNSIKETHLKEEQEQILEKNVTKEENKENAIPAIREESKIEEIIPTPELIKDIQPITEFLLTEISEPTEVTNKTKSEDTSHPIASTSKIKQLNTYKEKSSKQTEKNIVERFLTENLLSKIGIVTLVLGIGFFVKYAIDQEWINEIGRVGIGLLTGAIIIGIAHKLRNQYNVFSSILVGGGIAVFYITITLAFREYEIFSQPVAFALLIAVTLLSVLLSLFYNRKELAIFSLLGGFASPLMISTGEGNYIVLFSYILILNTGMLLVSFYKRWQIIGIISFALTIIFFWGWLFNNFTAEYLGATIFASLFFIQFYLLALFDHFKTDNKITPYQVAIILINNLSTFASLMFIYNEYEYNVLGIITICLAGVNALVMLILFRKSSIDRNMLFLVIAIVMTFVSLAIPIQLKGHVITMFWAAEMVILLLLWQKSEIQVFRIGFFIMCGLVIISYIMDLSNNYDYYPENNLPIIFNRMVATGLVVVGAFVICLFMMKKEDPDSIIKIKNTEICTMSFAIKIFKILLAGIIYIIPFLEINYQMNLRFQSSFTQVVLGTYTFSFIAILCLLFWKKTSYKNITYTLLTLSVVAYAVFYSLSVIELRTDIYDNPGYSDTSHFLIHLISLPAIAIIIFYLVSNIKKQTLLSYTVFGWVLAVLGLIILSVELDNIVIMLLGNPDNYYNILYDVHTFGYPILWGVVAMGLMIWGLKGKEVLLRKISLSIFAVTIIKFYAYDVWYMSQGGRIVSFVILGVILLLVSFLQQKIKILVKNENISEEENIEDNTIK